MAVSGFNGTAEEQLESILIVGGKEPSTHLSLQAAIDMSNPGDTILVMGGTYQTAIINKTIILRGYGGEVRGFSVLANNVSIEGFLIKDATYGVNIMGDNNVVVNCTICNTSYGIKIQGDGNAITDNKVFKNHHYAIGLRYAHNNLIARNSIYWNEWGVFLEHANANIVEHNVVRNNSQGIRVQNGVANILADNYIANNSRNGVRLCCSSEHNIIIRNNFLDNTDHAYAASAKGNVWNLHYTGNYWHTCNYCIKYIIDDENTDYHPATELYPLPDFLSPDSLFVTQPVQNSTVEGTVIVRGVAEHEAAVFIRIDNQTWERAIGLFTWQYLLATNLLENGLHILSVRCGDTQIEHRFYVNDKPMPGFSISLFLMALLVIFFLIRY